MRDRERESKRKTVRDRVRDRETESEKETERERVRDRETETERQRVRKRQREGERPGPLAPLFIYIFSPTHQACPM